VPLFIDGKFVQSKTDKWIDLRNPVRPLEHPSILCAAGVLLSAVANREYLHVCRPRTRSSTRCPRRRPRRFVPQSATPSTHGFRVYLLTRATIFIDPQMQQAADAAKRAYKTWRNVGVQHRQRVMLKLQHLIREHTEELALSITTEQGKTLPDARGDIFRGLEVVEYTCGAASAVMGETAENLANSLDTYSFKQPLGVCAGICPFNFPAMIPLWMFPVATVTGNTYIMKPSEKDPGASMVRLR
jgi:hypothetical protein